MGLTCYLSKLDGTGRVLLGQRVPTSEGSTAQVIVPLNDARTASVRVSMYDPFAMAALGPAYSRLLWVYYKPTILHTAKLVFLGPVHDPVWGYGDAVVTLNAHDPSIWAKKHNHRYGDIVVDRGYTIDGRGMRDLWSSAVPIESQIERGIKHPGVLWGYDDTPRLTRPPTKDYGKDPANSSIAYTSKVDRSKNVYESMTELSQVAGLETGVGGPDWDLLPLDVKDKSSYYSREDGVRRDRASRPEQVGANIWYAQLDTYINKGRELFQTVQFQYGFGMDNLDDIEINNDGDQEVNYSVVAYPGGESNKRDTTHRARYHNEPAWLDHGIIQNWVSSSNPDPEAVLKLKAKSFVDAYGWAPNFVNVRVRPDSYFKPEDGPRKYAFFDFEHGDRVRVGAKRGYAKFFVNGQPTNYANARVTQVQLSDDENGQTTQFVEMVPSMVVDSEEET